MTTHARPTGGLDAWRPFPAQLGPGSVNLVLRDTRGRLVIAEDHHPEGGMGSAVLEARGGAQSTPLRLAHLSVRIMPGSGTPGELRAAAAVDAASIDSALRHLVDDTNRQSDRQDASTPTALRRSTAPS